MLAPKMVREEYEKVKAALEALSSNKTKVSFAATFDNIGAPLPVNTTCVSSFLQAHNKADATATMVSLLNIDFIIKFLMVLISILYFELSLDLH